MRFVVAIEGTILKDCHRSMEIYAKDEEHAKQKAIKQFEEDQNKRGELQSCTVVSVNRIGKLP